MASSEGEDEDWNDVDIVPTELHEVNNIFCFAALADKKAGTMYTDQTGALPAISLDGHQYFFVAYDYDSNYIYAVPVKDLKDDTILEAFDEVFSDLKVLEVLHELGLLLAFTLELNLQSFYEGMTSRSQLRPRW